jgi:hypothetical protein
MQEEVSKAGRKVPAGPQMLRSLQTCQSCRVSSKSSMMSLSLDVVIPRPANTLEL